MKGQGNDCELGYVCMSCKNRQWVRINEEIKYYFFMNTKRSGNQNPSSFLSLSDFYSPNVGAYCWCFVRLTGSKLLMLVLGFVLMLIRSGPITQYVGILILLKLAPP